ncbi:MAG: DUF502 domain-containing protein [Candidatus Omnitrophota bacterium]|jgi:uncharacterized membrane protein
MSNFKRYFITGLLIVLPLFITFYLLFAIFVFIDGACGTLINSVLKRYLGLTMPGLGLIIGLSVIFFTGFLATNFLGKRLLHISERWLMRFSFIRQIYSPIKHIIHYVASRERPSFNKVVLFEYPSKGIWTIGFVTGEHFDKGNVASGSDLVAVYVASTPNPFTGYVVFVPRSGLQSLDITVEEGMRLIVSGGILIPGGEVDGSGTQEQQSKK